MLAGQLDKSLGLEDVAGIDKAKAQVTTLMHKTYYTTVWKLLHTCVNYYRNS